MITDDELARTLQWSVQKVAVEKSRLRELLVENGWAPHRLRVMSLHELRTAASQIGSEREERK